MFRADLHCHSTCSDGALHPLALLELAKTAGLQGISITDHDTIDAYLNHEVFQKDIQVLPGVEFTSIHREKSVHILAYAFSLKDPHIAALSKLHKIRRDERIRKMGSLLQKQGFDIDVEGIVSKNTMPGRPHLAIALFEKGYIRDPKDAFDLYIGDGKKCFVKAEAPSTEETLKIIKQANAVPVIAHPHLIKENKIIKDLLKMDFEGLEVFYGNFPYYHCDKWHRIAKEKNWLATGGSDFHGPIKAHIALGSSYTPEEPFNALLARYEENKLQ